MPSAHAGQIGAVVASQGLICDWAECRDRAVDEAGVGNRQNRQFTDGAFLVEELI